MGAGEMVDVGATGDEEALLRLAAAVADAAVVWVALAFGIDSSYIAGATPAGLTAAAREAADAYGAMSEDGLAGVHPQPSAPRPRPAWSGTGSHRRLGPRTSTCSRSSAARLG